MYLLQGFFKVSRHEKSGTLGCNPVLNREIFPKVPVWMELLWKLPLVTRPSIQNVMYQQVEYRIFPCLHMDLVEIIGTAWNIHYTWLTAIMGRVIPSSSMGRGVTLLRASANGISTPFLYLMWNGWYGKLLTEFLSI